jgi:hypothetical protein
MCYLVAVGKHVNYIRAVARQPPITTIEELLEAVFSVGFAPRLYSQDPRPAERVKLRDIRQTATTCSRWFLAREFFYPEDGGDTFLLNVSSHKNYTAPHPRKRYSSNLYIIVIQIATLFIRQSKNGGNLNYFNNVLFTLISSTSISGKLVNIFLLYT